MSISTDPRPWYCSNRAVEEYKTGLPTDDEKISMIRLYKILRWVVVNLALLLYGSYLLYLGGDPNLIGSLTLLGFAVYNGLEGVDYAAFARAVIELRNATDGNRED